MLFTQKGSFMLPKRINLIKGYQQQQGVIGFAKSQ